MHTSFNGKPATYPRVARQDRHGWSDDRLYPPERALARKVFGVVLIGLAGAGIVAVLWTAMWVWVEWMSRGPK